MRDLATLIQNPLWTKLGWTLAAFLWQGTLVAGLFACVNALLARRGPSVRYAAACLALLVMLACPIATFLGLDRSVVSPPVSGGETAVANAAAAPARVVRPAASPVPVLPRWIRSNTRELLPWLAPIWIAGVLVLSLRFLGGWTITRRLTRRAVAPAPAALNELLARLRARLRVARPVLLLQSAAVAVPTALGTLKPVILLPLSALTGLTPEGLEAVLAHELAHIRRRDYLLNLLQTAVETLLFYHPAVWWVSRRVRIERENCCDDLAVEVTGDARAYARALVGLEQIRASRPRLAVAANGGTLLARVARLLPAPPPSADAGSRWVAGALALAALAALGAASRVPALVEGAVSRTGDELALAGSATGVETAPTGKPHAGTAARPELAGVAGGVPGGVAGGVQGKVGGGILGGVRGGVRAALAGGVAGGVERGAAESRALSADELLELKRHGVTPEFLGELSALGYKQASLDDLLAVKIHGVTPEYISSMNALLGKLSLDELTSLKIHGVTPEFVRKFKDAGYSDLSVDSALALKIHGVTPEMAPEWSKLLGRLPSVDEIVSARIHGATPEWAAEIRSLGFETDLDSLVSMRIHGVTSDFVRAFQSLGYSRMSADEAVSLKIHGVAPDYARQVQSLGYKVVSLDELTELKIHGVSPEFIRDANRSASPRLSIDEILDLKIHRRKP
jgi:beta-lactamase regulating signal transducer with metallopeptidase domain